MPQYLISVWHSPGVQHHETGPYESEAAMQDAFQAVGEFNEALQAEGAWVLAGGLVPPEESVVVDGTRGAEPVITDGPFTHAQQHMGGFWVVTAAGPEQAEELAARASKACGNRVELRPFQS
ncbi:YciI family protein [Citricoccus nitrophenolicus]|uniref:YciI family protein n=1 Tax=Citricoccus nitrophenolicus TaxID=863575 RepID=UPI0031EF1EBB